MRQYTTNELEAMTIEALEILQAEVMEAWDIAEDVEPLIDLDQMIQVVLERKYDAE